MGMGGGDGLTAGGDICSAPLRSGAGGAETGHQFYVSLKRPYSTDGGRRVLPQGVCQGTKRLALAPVGG